MRPYCSYVEMCPNTHYKLGEFGGGRSLLVHLSLRYITEQSIEDICMPMCMCTCIDVYAERT